MGANFLLLDSLIAKTPIGQKGEEMSHNEGTTITDIGYPYAVYSVNQDQDILVIERSTGTVYHLMAISITKNLVYVQVREYPNRTSHWKCYSEIPGDGIDVFFSSVLEKALVNPTVQRGMVGKDGKLIPEPI